MLGWLWNVAGITLPGEAQGKTRGGGKGGQRYSGWRGGLCPKSISGKNLAFLHLSTPTLNQSDPHPCSAKPETPLCLTDLFFNPLPSPGPPQSFHLIILPNTYIFTIFVGQILNKDELNYWNGDLRVKRIEEKWSGKTKNEHIHRQMGVRSILQMHERRDGM